MPSDRSIAEEETLQCACGERFDVLEWHLIDVAVRLELARELARGEQRTHRCPACGVAQPRVMPLGLLVTSLSKPATVIAVVGESAEDPAQDPVCYDDVQFQIFDEPVAFVNVPWEWIALILSRDFDADFDDHAQARRRQPSPNQDRTRANLAGDVQPRRCSAISRRVRQAGTATRPGMRPYPSRSIWRRISRTGP